MAVGVVVVLPVVDVDTVEAAVRFPFVAILLVPVAVTLVIWL